MTETSEKMVWKRTVRCSLFQPCLLVSLYSEKRECFTKKIAFYTLSTYYTVNILPAGIVQLSQVFYSDVV